MDERTSRIAAALERLFRAYRQSDHGDPEAVARERIERFKLYLEAVEQHDVSDIETGVRSFLTGAAPGVNPNFLPPPPAVAAEVRRVMHLRLDAEARERARRPALPPPDHVISPEQRARGKAILDDLANKLGGRMRTDAAAAERRHRDRLARTNEEFDRRRTYAVGAPESEAEAG